MMSFLKYSIFLVLMAFGISVSAQMQQSRTNIFPKYGNFQNKGWIISPSLNYMMPTVKNGNDRIWQASGTPYNVEYQATGSMGFGLEFGRFHAIESTRLISYIDYTIGAKMLRGKESFIANLDDPDGLTFDRVEGGGDFSQTFITANFNATHAYTFSPSMAMHNTLGVNLDYEFASSYEYDTDIMNIDLNDPSDILLQAHYKLGIGFKMSKNIFVIPSVETPLVTIVEYDDLKSTALIFNSRYRPFIFRVTVMLLDDKADRKCPTKNGKRKKSESLFGKR